MAVEFKLPDLGEGIDSGDVVSVLISEGDTIAKEQGIVELETEKAVVEVPSSLAGKVTKIHVASGDTVKVGDVLLTVDTADVDTGEAKPKASPPQQDEPKQVAAKKQPPKAVSAADSDVDAEETPPEPDMPNNQPSSPSPSPAKRKQGETVTATVVAEPDNNADTDDDLLAPAGPAVRRFARELGIDITQVRGTGTGGRVRREDVVEAVRQSNQSSDAGVRKPPAPPKPAPKEALVQVARPGELSADAWGPIRLERMSKIRQTIAERMHQSKSTAPHVTNFDDADVTDLEKVRRSSKDDYAAKGIKLTAMPFIVKAVAMALRDHPTVNASLDLDNQQIVYKDYVNVGIAVDTDRGLVVPVLRNTDEMSIPQIARAIAEASQKARNTSYTMDDLRGGTFTISNLGAIGGTYSTPVINYPEVAILLVGRSRKLPVVRDDQIVPRFMMPLSLSYDHRLVDGAVAARFLNEVIGYLEAPARLLLAP